MSGLLGTGLYMLLKDYKQSSHFAEYFILLFISGIECKHLFKKISFPMCWAFKNNISIRLKGTVMHRVFIKHNHFAVALALSLVVLQFLFGYMVKRAAAIFRGQRRLSLSAVKT